MTYIHKRLAKWLHDDPFKADVSKRRSYRIELHYSHQHFVLVLRGVSARGNQMESYNALPQNDNGPGAPERRDLIMDAVNGWLKTAGVEK